ncbi:MAG: hypothetical protein K5697_09895 [Lachnospiraceae bacterium]|nr:hypothetical protein [Lachnospiraceae bacterium]
MHRSMQNRNTIIYLAVFLLVGMIHVVENYVHDMASPDYSFVTLCYCLVFVIYSVILIVWIQSVHIRLLPSRVRNYMTAAVILMVFFLFLRAFRYRITENATALRYAWYCYYLPQTLIPGLFLMVCIRTGKLRKERWGDERILLFPAGILAFLVLTNDLHHLIFVPHVAISEFIGDSGSYSYRPIFYLIYVWMGLAILIGLCILLRGYRDGRGIHFKKILPILGVILFWVILLFLHSIKDKNGFELPYEVPEINIFCMVTIFEICIREHLIPHNENYAGFFAKLLMPVIITDGELHRVYYSANTFEANRRQLLAALEEPVYLQPEQKLSGRAISGGYAFWMEDESEVRRANEKLTEANELLESENTLIEYENKQKEEHAYLESRHHIYHEIAEQMYPYQKRIRELLEKMQPGAEAFREQLAYVSVLNAFVKRKTNFLLLSSEKDRISCHELFLAISESGRYLSYVGLRASVDENGFREAEDADFPAGIIISLYDSFEEVVEQLIGHAGLLMVSFSAEGLKLATDTDSLPQKGKGGLPIQSRRSDDILYLSIGLGRGGR